MAASPTTTCAAPFIRIITVCGSRATVNGSSKPTTAARRSRSTAEGRGTGASTSCSRKSTASATTTRTHTTSAAEFRTTTPTAGRPIRSVRSESRTPTGAPSATTATVPGSGRSPVTQARSGTSASASSTDSSASSICAPGKTTTSRRTSPIRTAARWKVYRTGRTGRRRSPFPDRPSRLLRSQRAVRNAKSRA